MIEQAKRYARMGWRVFPVHGINGAGECTCGTPSCPDKGKHPVPRRWMKEATSDEDKIEALFSNPNFNLAIVTGEVSGITVLDIDIGDGKLGAETWTLLNDEAGEPETLMARTGSGGMHVFFKYNSALNTSSNTLGPGVDCRNDKGYVVAAPSKHRSGGQYEWINEGTPLADMPAHLARRKETRGRKRKGDPTKKKYTLEQTKGMLERIPADDRDLWRTIGIILGREFQTSDAAWAVYNDWAAKWDGPKGRNHDAIMRDCFYEESKKAGDLSIGTIVHHALQNGWTPEQGRISIDHFVFFSPAGDFIYRPTADHWPPASVDALVAKVNDGGNLISATDWLRANRFATSITSDPLLEEYTRGIDMKDGNIIENKDGAVYNNYWPPQIKPGDSRLAGPFLDHVRLLLPKEGDADQFLNYMAHRVQKPGEKPRFALLISGEQGIGKDTIISMCGPAIGEWNCVNIQPADIDSKFNEFKRYVLVNVSEAANHAEMTKWAFNEQLKVLIAGNPDNQQINEKYGRKYSVRMHCGVVLTTNNLIGGIYIPQDDRRYDVMECASKHEMGLESASKRGDYFANLWAWYNEMDGAAHVAAFLQERDISKFSAATGQRITEAHLKVVQEGFVGDDWALDALLVMSKKASDTDELIAPPMFTYPEMLEALKIATGGEVREREVRAKMERVLARQGYHKLNNARSKDGRWKVRDGDAQRWVTVFYAPQRISAVEAANRAPTLEMPKSNF